MSSLIIVVPLLGCSNLNGRVGPPTYASDAGSVAIATFDKDGDQLLNTAELTKAPSLLAAISQIDTNNDGKLTAGEIDARVRSRKDSRVGEMMVNCQVIMDGSPLPMAQVVLEAVSFLGAGVHSGSGTTDTNGYADISMPAEFLADERYSGMTCGWYNIKVTVEGLDIPARYNTETTLGCEVALDAHWVGGDRITINLISD